MADGTIRLPSVPGGLGVFADQDQPLDLRPTRARPVVGQYGPETDAALQRAAELGIQVALPLGLAGLGGPAAMGLGRLAPALTQSGLGPFTHPDPSVLQGSALPDPEEAAGDLASRVLGTAASKRQGPTYAQWVKQNPGAEETLGWDFAGAKPAMPERTGDLPRYQPPRGTSARMRDALADPQVGRALRAAVRNGISIMPESWYRTGPLYEAFQQELGEAAPDAYQRFIGMVAATSPRNKVPDNVRTASYYNYLDQTGQPLPKKPAAGYGSLAQKLHLQNVRNVQAGGIDPLQNPKPPSFSENLLGNERPITSDTHNFRMVAMASKDPRFLVTNLRVKTGTTPGGKDIYTTIKPRQLYNSGQLTMEQALQKPDYWASAPGKNEYAAYEAWQQAEAKKMGLTPAEWQEKMWVGGGETTGLGSPPESFIRTVAKRVAYTASKLNISPQEVLEKFVRGETPLLGIGAATLGVPALVPRGQRPRAAGQEPPE